MKPLLTIAIAIITLLPVHSIADSNPLKHRVEVQVQCDDENLKSTIESFVKGNLRQLGDVDIVEEKPDYIIDLIVVTTSLFDGGENIHSIAYRAVDIYSLRGRYKQLFSPKSPTKELTFNIVMDAQRERTVYSWLRIIPQHYLTEACRDIAVEFDQQILKYRRARKQLFKDAS